MNSRRILLGIAALSALLTLSACATGAAGSARASAAAAAYYPGGKWRRSTPEEPGVDSQAIADLVDMIAKIFL